MRRMLGEKEVIILVPAVVYAKAKELREHKCYEAAIELLNDNKIELTVYNEVRRRKAA